MIHSDDDIFNDAHAQLVAGRDAYLDEACGGDAACRARIAALLAAHDDAAGFFASPVTAHFARMPEEKPGDRIGRYKLLEIIGEGAGAAVGLALLLGATISTWQAMRATRAEREKARMLVNESALRRRAEDAELATRRRAYVADINRVQQALASDHLSRAQDLLNRQRPQPGESDLRGWEWRHLWQSARSDAHSTLTVKDDTAIVSLAASADGHWLAAGEEKYGQLSVWDLRTREEIRVPADVASVRVTFSPTEPLLAFATAGGEYFDFNACPPFVCRFHLTPWVLSLDWMHDEETCRSTRPRTSHETRGSRPGVEGSRIPGERTWVVPRQAR